MVRIFRITLEGWQGVLQPDTKDSLPACSGGGNIATRVDLEEAMGKE